MKQISLIIWGCLLYTTLYAQPSLGFKGDGLKNAGYSVYVIDATDGKVFYETPR